MKPWHGNRQDIPETWWDAAVLLDKLKQYSKHMGGDNQWDNWDIYNKAHDSVNVAMVGVEYVSTYVAR